MKDKNYAYDSVVTRDLFLVEDKVIKKKIKFSLDKVECFLDCNLEQDDINTEIVIYDEDVNDILTDINAKTKMIRKIIKNDNIKKVTLYVSDENLKHYINMFSILKIPKEKQDKFFFNVSINKNVIENKVTHLENLDNFYSKISFNIYSENNEDIFLWYDVETLSKIEKNMMFDKNIVKSTIGNMNFVNDFYKLINDNYEIGKLSSYEIVFLAYKYIRKNTDYKYFVNGTQKMVEVQSKLMSILLCNPYSTIKSFPVYGIMDGEIHCCNAVIIDGYLYTNFILDGLFEKVDKFVPFENNKQYFLYKKAFLTREQVLMIEDKLKNCKKKTNRLVK